MPADRARIVVIYEDSRPPTNSFGFHDLLLSMCADALQPTLGRWPIEDLQRLLRAVPKKGNTKVRAFVESELDILARGRPVLVVLDEDKAHRIYDPDRLSAEEARARLEETVASPRVRVFLLARNLETVCANALDAQTPAPPELEQWRAGATKGVPTERDLLLKTVARQDRAALRSAMLILNGSLAPIRNAMVELAMPLLSGTP